MDQQQRQILAFERESVLPSSKYLEDQNLNQIQNKVPFEYDSKEEHQKYSEELENFIEYFSSKKLANIDNSMINELADETAQPIQEVTAVENSIISSLVSNQRENKWS